MGKTLKYGSHDFSSKHGFTGSATDGKKVSVRPHVRAGKVMPPQQRARPVREAAAEVASKGRNGDSTLAHVSPREVSILKQVSGNPGTTNPDTGLPEFFAGGPGGVGRDSGGAVAGGASGIGGRGADTTGAGAHGSLGNAGAMKDVQGATHAAATVGGNENAAVGVATRGNPSPTAARNAMSGALSRGLAVNKQTGALSTTAVNAATNPLGVFGALLDLYSGLDESANPDPVASAISEGAGYVNSVAPGGLGLVAGGAQLGVDMGQVNKAIKDAIDAGAINGTNVNTNTGDTISRVDDGIGGLHGSFNSGQTNSSQLDHDINAGTFGGDVSKYGRDPQGRGGALNDARTILAQNVAKNAAAVTPLFSPSATPIQPIIPTQTNTFKKGGRPRGKPAFNSTPLYGKR